MNKNELYEEIPHELKECGRIQLKKIFHDSGYIVIPDHVVDRTGYYIFKQVFTAKDIMHPIRYKYLGWRKLLEQAMCAVKSDYMSSCKSFEVDVYNIVEEDSNEMS